MYRDHKDTKGETKIKSPLLPSQNDDYNDNDADNNNNNNYNNNNINNSNN